MGWLGRWKKFDVMVDVVVWGDACLLACPAVCPTDFLRRDNLIRLASLSLWGQQNFDKLFSAWQLCE